MATTKKTFGARVSLRIVLLVLLLTAIPALAVWDSGLMELDGNLVDDVAPGGSDLPTDWADLFSGGNPGGNPLTLPPQAIDSVFVHDEASPDSSIFTGGGSKDDLNIPSWQCDIGNATPDKNNILHTYAVVFKPTSGPKAGRTLVYMAMERFANDGDANAAFWLLQDPNVSCTAPGNFTGSHVTGDLLIVTEFSNGGTVSDIKVYKWVGSSLNTTPIASGADCSTAPANADVCGRTNAVTITTPWATQDKTSPPNTLLISEFFEVGIDLTAMGTGACYYGLINNTRTSTSLNATLKDYTFASISTCSADLAVIKTDSSDPILVGQTLTYTLTVTNNGPDKATGVVLTDTLPAGVLFGSATPSQGSCSHSAGVVTCNLGSLNNLASATVTITVTPTTAGVKTNTATVTTNEADTNPANDTATELTTVEGQANLSVTKSDSPDPATVGQNLAYTLIVTNAGPIAATGVVLTDTLPGSVTFVSAVASQGACTHSLGTVTCNLGTISNGGTVTVTIVVTPTAPGTITNAATVTANEPDPDTNNNTDSEDTTVNAAADLVVNKNDAPDPLIVGQSLTYTVTVSNLGPVTATNVVLTDTLPGSVAFVSATPTQGSCSESGGVVTCNFGTIPNGNVVAVTITVIPTAPGLITNTATVTGDQSDPNSNNNTDTENTQVNPAPDLSVNKSHTGNFSVGQNGVYTITVTNVGAGSTIGPIVVSDTLPTGLTFISGTGPGWSCSAAGQIVTCTSNITLAPSATTSITLTVSVGAAAVPVVTNTVSVSTPGDNNTGNNTDDDPTVVNAPDLAINKSHTGSFTVGQNGVYTITVTNVGLASTIGTITVTDTLPAGLTFISGTGPGWTCSAFGQTVTCTHPGPLAPNASTSITLTVSVGAAAAPGVINSVSVDTPADDDPSNDTDNDDTIVNPVADLSLTKTVNNPMPNIGSNIIFTITVSNSGPNDATNVAVADALPAGLTFVSATASQGSYNNTLGVWTIGTIANGANVTLQITATVTSSGPITNTAQVSSSDQIDPDSTPNNNNPNEDDQQSITLTQLADLSLTKTVSAPSGGVGHNVTFTITVTNAGPNTASNIAIQDQLPVGLTLVSATPSQGTYNGLTGIWAVGTLASSASATLALVVKPTTPGNFTNIAQVIASDQSDPDSVPNNNNPTEDDQDDVSFTALPADLTINKSHNGNFLVGQTGLYTLTVSNLGPGHTTDPITVTDTLPTGLTFVSGIGSGWTCSAALQVVTCTNPGPLASGANSVITLTVSVGPEAAPNVTNCASVSTPDDTNTNNNNDCDPTTVIGPDLAIQKNHTGNFTIGQTATYTITVTNVGPIPTVGTITVTDTLPNGLVFISGTGTGWVCTALGQTITCINAGPLAPSQSSQITITLHVGVTQTQTVINIATVSTPGDTNITNNSDDDPTEISVCALGEVHGFKWLDLDGDGNVSSNETFLPGITIRLLGTDLFGQPVNLTTVTDAQGNYWFMDLLPGNYIICEELGPGLVQTFPRNGPVCPNGTIGWPVVIAPTCAPTILERRKFGNTFDEPTFEALAVHAVQTRHSENAIEFYALGQFINGLRVEIFDLSGRAVFQSDWEPNGLTWKLQNKKSQRVAQGVYFYRLFVRGAQGEIVKMKLQKLIVSPRAQARAVSEEALALSYVDAVENSGLLQFRVAGRGIASAQLAVFDMSGRRVFSSDWQPRGLLLWTLHNQKGERVAKGVYLYVITVRGSHGEIVKSKIQKLIVR